MTNFTGPIRSLRHGLLEFKRFGQLLDKVLPPSQWRLDRRQEQIRSYHEAIALLERAQKEDTQ